MNSMVGYAIYLSCANESPSLVSDQQRDLRQKASGALQRWKAGFHLCVLYQVEEPDYGGEDEAGMQRGEKTQKESKS